MRFSKFLEQEPDLEQIQILGLIQLQVLFLFSHFSMLKNFRTFQLAIKFYNECKILKIPRHLKDQLNKASSSIALNLAEGYGKFSHKDQWKYFHISFASLRESQTILILSELNNSNTYKMSDHLAASIYKLIKASNK